MHVTQETMLYVSVKCVCAQVYTHTLSPLPLSVSLSQTHNIRVSCCRLFIPHTRTKQLHLCFEEESLWWRLFFTSLCEAVTLSGCHSQSKQNISIETICSWQYLQTIRHAPHILLWYSKWKVRVTNERQVNFRKKRAMQTSHSSRYR